MRFVLALSFLWLGFVGAQPEAGALTGEYNEAYYVLDELNAGLSDSDEAFNLQTPQAALEHFVLSSRADEFVRAARALNLNLLPEAEQAEAAPELARKLFYLLESKNLINWDALPDRPDGQVAAIPGSTSPQAGSPRRTLLLGELTLDNRPISINVQRVRVAEGEPVWVFSANTVENIPALYETFGPTALDRALPTWSKNRPFWGVAVWEWGALLLLIVACALFGWLTSTLSNIIAERTGDDFVSALIDRVTAPIALTVAFGLLFGLTSGGLPFTDAVLSFVSPLMWVLFIVALIWLGSSLINYVAERYREVQIQDLDEDAKEKERKRRTLISVGRRAFIFLAVLLGLGVMLSRFANLEVIGTTLLTSAGIAGAVLGIAAQPSLGNIIAGIQIAVTRPVSIGDTVIVDDSWAYVEDLRYTYAVIRTWDERRILLPLRDIITEKVENWTHTDTHLVKPIYLYVDYDTDVKAVREKFCELVEQHELYDGETEPKLLVTDMSDEVITLRCAVSGKNPEDAWALECDVREQLLKFLQDLNDGKHLPRQRVQLTGSEARASQAAKERKELESTSS